ELQNVPCFAADLHYRDVVRAVRDDDGLRIVTVVRRSGHQTVRVVFADALTDAEIRQLLAALKQAFGPISWEHAQGGFYALDVAPGADRAGLYAYLWQLHQDGLVVCDVGTRGSDPID